MMKTHGVAIEIDTEPKLQGHLRRNRPDQLKSRRLVAQSSEDVSCETGWNTSRTASGIQELGGCLRRNGPDHLNSKRLGAQTPEIICRNYPCRLTERSLLPEGGFGVHEGYWSTKEHTPPFRLQRARRAQTRKKHKKPIVCPC